jgi:hypothetical protein
MQRYTIFFIAVNALHVSGGFSIHHQELKNCTYSSWYMTSLLAATTSVGELELVCMHCWKCTHVYTSNNAYRPHVYTSNNAYKPVPNSPMLAVVAIKFDK